MNILYHSANDFPVGQRQIDGYIDATRLCQAVGKRWNNYYRVPEHKAYFKELSSQIKMPVIVNNPETPGSGSALVEVFKGGNSQQGTWVHPQVAIHLAMWLDPKFAVQVTQWVFNWMTTGQNPIERSQPPQPQPSQPEAPKSLPAPPDWKEEVWEQLPEEDKQHFLESPDQVAARVARERQDIARYLNKCWWVQ